MEEIKELMESNNLEVTELLPEESGSKKTGLFVALGTLAVVAVGVGARKLWKNHKAKKQVTVEVIEDDEFEEEFVDEEI